ncbi:hypothetical protein OAN307_c06990 [Octadecabacter antarcticus 307]|uniref:Uncharacterized protein n=1 Tax=Octadecabacter antarcticus 307 TaxID=391626 RepID=M9R7Z7_9RHOB|nr:trimethylamine methyltransferase family protein [Octadecabacter antarcticus]AGI66426.1 hypothetical protein OAN307_c06990 [Octadecabacter antarcticus 307]
MLRASFEAFVLDDGMYGIEVREENLGFDAIRAAILGDGHFLGSNHIFNAIERDYHCPTLADREQPRTWAEAGAQDAWARAKICTMDILATHKPSYLTPSQDSKICAACNILA